MTRYSNNKLHLDYTLIFLYVALVISGWFTLYAVTGENTLTNFFDFTTSYGKQLLYILFSVILIVVVLSIENKFYESYSGIFYIISIVLLLGLFVFGKNINGQTNWYVLGGFSLQPSEFVKITTALSVSSVIADNLFDVKRWKDIRLVILLVLLPVFIILIQKDTGSALVFSAFIFVMLRRGLPIIYLYYCIIIALLFIMTIKFGVIATLISVYIVIISFLIYAVRKQALFFQKNTFVLLIVIFTVTLIIFGSKVAYNKVLEPHHKDRIHLWLRMENNPEKIKQLKKTYGYNNDQSIQTIASGGFAGKGYLQGDRTNGKFVPAQYTDYIFSAVGEEFGFLGSAIVVVLFISLILRLLYKADKQKSKFSMYYGYSVASIFFIHFAINIGMVLDLLPTVGIPLPFFSYGGSSLFAFTILLFIFIKMDGTRLDDF